MRWFKIHVSVALGIAAALCLHDAMAKDEHGWVVAMALIVGMSVYHVREATCDND